MRLLSTLLVVLALPIAVRAQRPPASLIAAVQGVAPGAADSLQYALVDLNGDSVPDAIVLLGSEGWCGTGGCTMLVFRGRRDRFALVSRSTITNVPIRVLPDTTHGWRTLIVYSKGVGDVLLRFDGLRYPPNPSLQLRASPEQVAAARVVIQR